MPKAPSSAIAKNGNSLKVATTRLFGIKSPERHRHKAAAGQH